MLSANLDFSVDWKTANRTSAHLAPLAEKYKDAVIQVYAARAYGWRGLFAVHTWVSIKAKEAASYKVYQVIDWRTFYGLPPLSIEEDIPDLFLISSASVLSLIKL